MKIFWLAMVLLMLICFIGCDDPDAEAPDQWGEDLVNMINHYRNQNGLESIPYSPALTETAVAHVEDLGDNHPDEKGDCNLHSWSDQGDWTPCCYTPDHAEAQCMWDKPAEIAGYPGYGYEIAAKGTDLDPDQALGLWKNSTGHNDVILNQGIWTDNTFLAIGAAITKQYAVVWFGESEDLE